MIVESETPWRLSTDLVEQEDMMDILEDVTDFFFRSVPLSRRKTCSYRTLSSPPWRR